MSQTLKLKDEVLQALKEAARGSGISPEEWIVAHLPWADRQDGGLPTTNEIARANARLRKHIISSGQPGSCDNQQIDADLAREYGDDHARIYRREKG